MKVLPIFLSLAFSITGQAQHFLEKIWESDTSLKVPESVLYDKDVLYVSLVDGQAWDIDGKGEITKLDKNSIEEIIIDENYKHQAYLKFVLFSILN